MRSDAPFNPQPNLSTWHIWTRSMFEPSHKSSEEVHSYMQRIIRKHIWLYKKMFSLWLMLGEGVIPKQVHFLFSIPDCFNKILFVTHSLMTWSRNKVNIYLISYTFLLHQRAPAFNFSSQYFSGLLLQLKNSLGCIINVCYVTWILDIGLSKTCSVIIYVI